MLPLLSKLKRSHHKFILTKEFRKDLEWWRKFLDHFNGTAMLHSTVQQNPDSVFSTDACLLGYGGYFKGNYFLKQFLTHFLENNIHINGLEYLH